MSTVGRIQIIKLYFESEPHGRKVTMAEMKALASEERAEIADLVADDQGLTRRTEDGKIVYVGS